MTCVSSAVAGCLKLLYGLARSNLLSSFDCDSFPYLNWNLLIYASASFTEMAGCSGFTVPCVGQRGLILSRHPLRSSSVEVYSNYPECVVQLSTVIAVGNPDSSFTFKTIGVTRSYYTTVGAGVRLSSINLRSLQITWLDLGVLVKHFLPYIFGSSVLNFAIGRLEVGSLSNYHRQTSAVNGAWIIISDHCLSYFGGQIPTQHPTRHYWRKRRHSCAPLSAVWRAQLIPSFLRPIHSHSCCPGCSMTYFELINF